jgi:hypothetical protein
MEEVMIDIKFLRENPEVVKENIRKKFQDEKLSLVDEVIALDAESRKAKQEADDLRASRNRISKEIGALMGQGKKEEAEAKKAEVAAGAKRLAELEASETELQEKITKIMMVIPNIIDESVPIGKDDSQNVEIEKFGEPIVPDFEVPYHADILDRLNGLAVILTDRNGLINNVGDDHHDLGDLLLQFGLGSFEFSQALCTGSYFCLLGFCLFLLALTHQCTDFFGNTVSGCTQIICFLLCLSALGIQCDHLIYQRELFILEFFADVLLDHLGIFS